MQQITASELARGDTIVGGSAVAPARVDRVERTRAGRTVSVVGDAGGAWAADFPPHWPLAIERPAAVDGADLEPRAVV